MTDDRHENPEIDGEDKASADLAKEAENVDPSDVVGIARVTGSALKRAMSAITKIPVDTATGLVRDVRSGEPITAIIDKQVEDARSAALQALGLDDRTGLRKIRGTTEQDLKAMGTAILDSSWNLANQPRDEHPSFAQMLQALTPDEARILRFLAVSGPQPSLDVRTKTPFGIGSERIVGGMSMIAEMSGCSYPEMDKHYLANLNRLGLVRFSEEPVKDFRRYSFIEAQPKVQKALHSARKAMTVYRSIYLSLFGIQFCEACFELEGYDAGGWATDDRGDKILGRGGPRPKKIKHH